MNILIFDTETTGLLPKENCKKEDLPRIIEVGAALVNENGIIRELSKLVNPQTIIPKAATKINKITNEMVASSPTFVHVLPDLIDLFSISDVLVCHNASFDTGMLNIELELMKFSYFPWPHQTICTVREFEHEFGYRPTLKELYNKYIGHELEQKHRALDDVKALYEVLLTSGLLDRLNERT